MHLLTVFAIVLFCSVGTIRSDLASLGQFPYHVMFTSNAAGPPPQYGHYCGGVIIDARHVLTMGSCFRFVRSANENYEYKRTILAGCVDVYNGACDEYEVEDYKVHPEWSAAMQYPYNFGLITLLEDIRFNENVAPIPIEMDYVRRNTSGVTLRWNLDGQAEWETVSTSKICECVEKVRVWEPYYGSDYEDQFVCATTSSGTSEDGTKVGNPLVVDGSLVGVNVGDFGDGFYIYTRTEFYASFIDNIITSIN